MHNQPHTLDAKVKMSIARKGIPAMWKRRETIVENGIIMYRCGRCKGFFPHDGFYKNRRTILGITNECRKCHCQTAIFSRDLEVKRANNLRNEAKRRARAASSEIRLTVDELYALGRLFGERCLKCGATQNLQWDHIVPLAKGGKHSIGNLQRLCRKCNEHKHTTVIDCRSEEQKTWVITFERCEKPESED